MCTNHLEISVSYFKLQSRSLVQQSNVRGKKKKKPWLLEFYFMIYLFIYCQKVYPHHLSAGLKRQQMFPIVRFLSVFG